MSQDIHKKRKWSNMKVLLLYFGFCAIVMTVAFLMVQKLIAVNNRRQMNVTVGLVADKMNHSLESMSGYAEELAALLSVGDLTDLSIRQEEISRILPQMRCIALGIVDGTGKIYGTQGDAEDLEKYGFLSRAVNERETFITEPYLSGTEGIHVMSFFAPIYQEDAYKGSVYLIYPLKEIQALAEIDRIHTDAETLLLNAFSGNIVHCSNNSSVPAGSWDNIRLHVSQLQMEEGSSLEDWMQSMRAGEDTGIISYKESGVAYTHMFQNLSLMDEWYITVRISDKYLSGAMQNFLTGTVIVVSLLVLATLLLGFFFLRQEYAKRKQLSELSSMDPLTNTLNNRAFQAQVEKFFEDCQGQCRGVLIFFDLDDFKSVNDTLGHAAGDQVLCTFAESLQHTFGKAELVARIGGDEFNVFLKKTVSVEEVDRRMDELRGRLRRVTLEEGDEVSIRFSAGLAQYPEDAKTLEKLKKHADEALYYIKNTGKCSHCWYFQIPGETEK